MCLYMRAKGHQLRKSSPIEIHCMPPSHFVEYAPLNFELRATVSIFSCCIRCIIYLRVLVSNCFYDFMAGIHLSCFGNNIFQVCLHDVAGQAVFCRRNQRDFKNVVVRRAESEEICPPRHLGSSHTGTPQVLRSASKFRHPGGQALPSMPRRALRKTGPGQRIMHRYHPELCQCFYTSSEALPSWMLMPLFMCQTLLFLNGLRLLASMSSLLSLYSPVLP
jgi:hypothetical protein